MNLQAIEYCYIAFDLFPSKKGAATHINHCLQALQKTFDRGLLICLGSEEMPTFQYDEKRRLYVFRFKQRIVNFLERSIGFQEKIKFLLQKEFAQSLKVIHFRDIWGGQVALSLKKQSKKLIFEVNALSSIELPNRYPHINKRTLNKIRQLEEECLRKSTTIITPSRITYGYLVNNFDIEKNKVILIPNCADVAVPRVKKEKGRLIYLGALQKWQGIPVLLKSLREVLHLKDVRLSICSAVPKKKAVSYQALAEDIGVAHKVDWFFELDKNLLYSKIAAAQLSLAPLTECDRNLIQGCNPLKIIESMACGTPVLASEIPVVEEIIMDGETGFLIRADRPQLWGRKIIEILEKESLLEKTREKALKEVQKKYTVAIQIERMQKMYL